MHAVGASVGDWTGMADLAIAAPAPCTSAASRSSPARVRGPTTICSAWVRPSGATARVGHRGQPDPAPRHREVEVDQGIGDWPSGVQPSNVAALTVRLRSTTGPRGAGARTSGLTPPNCNVF